ncbi:WD repeat-containing protein [Acrasis kona]|uniref:WD repeat-containing protein n=1 Tax=Acrasis kona TaxID=1008807 RepID=A0AAW2ZRZ5_9EUKA
MDDQYIDQESLHDPILLLSNITPQKPTIRSYNPVETRKYFQEAKIVGHQPKLGGLNFIACIDETLFIAEDDKIFCYNLLGSNFRSRTTIKLDGEAHFIRAVTMNDNEKALIVVGEYGLTNMYVKSNGTFKPLKFNSDEESTWSTCFSKQLGLLITGSNAFTLKCTPIAQNSSDRPFILSGHEHNVPCIDISSCGQYVASCSIDCNLKLWHLPTKKCISTWSQPVEVGHEEWMWSVKWIHSKYIFNMTDDSCSTLSPSSMNKILGSRRSYCFTIEEEEGEDSDKEMFPKGELIVAASRYHLFLIDGTTMTTLHGIYMDPCNTMIPPVFKIFSRLCLVEVIPELSLVLVASQSDVKVVLLRIVRNVAGSYRLVPEKYLPERQDTDLMSYDPINSFCYEKINQDDSISLPKFRIYILTYQGAVHSYVISGRRREGTRIQYLDVSEVIL